MGSGCLSAEAEATWAPGDSDLSPAWPDKALASGTPPPRAPGARQNHPHHSHPRHLACGGSGSSAGSPGPDNPHCQCSSWALGCWCRLERRCRHGVLLSQRRGKLLITSEVN